MTAILDMDGLGEFRETLNRIRARVSDLRPYLNRVAIEVRKGFAEMFNTEGAAGGERWKPLAPSTIAAKQQMFEAGEIRGRIRGIRARLRASQLQAGEMPGILIRTGALKDSVVRRGFRGNIHRIGGDGRSVELGTSVPYAAVHEYGGTHEYPIAPVNKPVLAWFGIQKGGKPGWCYARMVPRHPPLARRSFLVVTEDAWNEIMRLSEELLSGAEAPVSAED